MEEKKSRTMDWHKHIQDERIIYKDPLLQCLCTITKLYHKPLSPDTLVAGLPIDEGYITPELFIRAAKRVKMSAKLAERQLSDIKSLILPAVLLLNNGEACVLTQINVDSTMTIIRPETGIGCQIIDQEELETHYSGYAILIRPRYEFHQLSTENALPKHEHWFWGAIKAAMPIYGEMLVASFLINLFALAVPLFVMNVYDRVIPNYAVDTLWVLSLGVFIVLTFDFIMRQLRSYFIDVAGKNIDIQLSSEIFEKILGLKMAVRPKSVGSLANTVTAFSSFRDFITSASISAIVDFPFLLLFLGIIGYIGGYLALVPLTIIPLIFAVSYAIQLPLNNETKKLYRTAGDKQSILFEALNGIETVKSMGAEAPLQARWERAICYAARHSMKVKFLSNLSANFSLFMQYLSTVLIIIVGVYLVSSGNMTVGALVACSILTGRALAPVLQISALIAKYYQSNTAFKALTSVMQAKVDRPQGKQYLYHPHISGEIEFNHVSFNYPNQQLKALDDLSFHIKPGEKVGIIGRMGSGKSTIDKLIMGLYQPNSGNVLIDGIDMQQLDPAELAQQIGYVPQNIVLFNGSIRENITVASPHASGSAIRRAAKLSQLDNFTKTHPDGIDMQVGEKGDAISGGQKQAIAIARALLMEPKILILDEPTSAMDERTEQELVASMQQHTVDKTLIVVTHRASMLSLVDRLIVLENGHIIADGSKKRIIAALGQGKIKYSV